MKIIYILWEDACGADGWVSKERIVADQALVKVETVGFLVGETEKTVTVTMADNPEGRSIGAWLTIPKSSILKRKILKR